MQRITGYETGGGSPAADAALEGIARMFGGMIPNFHKVMANSPAAIAGFEGLYRALQKIRLRAVEREIVALEVSRRQACAYCTAAHAAAARGHGLDEADLRALLDGRPMADPRRALIQWAAGTMIEAKGTLEDGAYQALRDAGLGDTDLIEIAAVIGCFTWATLVANLAQIEIDPAFRR